MVRRAFTLVELLVVIGIIAVLIGILLPALSRARGAANTLRCSANMRAMGQAAMLYATEHRGRIPRDMFGKGYFFASQIMRQIGQPEIPSTRVQDMPYINDRYKRVKVFQCPSVVAPDYGLHYTINSIDFDKFRKTGTYDSVDNINVVRFPRPSEVAYFLEANVPSKVLTPSTYGEWDVWKVELMTFNGTAANASPRMIHARDNRHRGRTNITFLDGHVELRWIKPKELSIRLFNPYAK